MCALKICSAVRIALACLRPSSTKQQLAAPRDSASMPSAPLPANRSRQRAPSIRGASQSNRVCRIRSGVGRTRSDEHTSELQSLMRISYDVSCLKKKKNHKLQHRNTITQDHSYMQ